MTLPREVLIAIGRAVEKQGGTLEDAEDLIEVWERLAADKYGRVDRLRAEAASLREISRRERRDDGSR
jgi:hypothetical protein